MAITTNRADEHDLEYRIVLTGLQHSKKETTQMTKAQIDEGLRQWLATRKEAGLKIDIATCEIGGWYADDFDEYGSQRKLPQDVMSIGYWIFVRSPESDGWVSEGDLPEDKHFALWERLDREADTYENYLKRPKESAELWQAKHNLWEDGGKLCLLHKMEI